MCSNTVDLTEIFPPLENLSPDEFEELIKSWFEQFGDKLESFEVNHLEKLPGVDGEYTFDVTVHFRAFQGAEFLLLIECKKHKAPIKREVVQLLHDRLRSVGGHKGFIFATTSFQSGAFEYARQHGIALVQVVPGGVMYLQATAAKEHPKLPSYIPRFIGCHFSPNGGTVLLEFISRDDVSILESLIALNDADVPS